MNSEQTYYGDVIWFNPKRGIGFILWEKDNIKQKDLFVHYSDLQMPGFKTLFKDQKVSFKLGANIHGIIKAINVEILRH